MKDKTQTMGVSVEIYHCFNNIKLLQAGVIPAVNRLTCSEPILTSVSISHMQF